MTHTPQERDGGGAATLEESHQHRAKRCDARAGGDKKMIPVVIVMEVKGAGRPLELRDVARSKIKQIARAGAPRH